MYDYHQNTQAYLNNPHPSRGYLTESPRSTERLIQSLLSLPDYWKLVPCRNKIPLGREWGKHFFSPKILFRSLTQEGYVWVKGKKGYYQAKPNGISLLCGTQLKSDRYLVAIDCDSQTALDKVVSKNFPPTITYCSGKEGRRQYLYYSDSPIKSFKTKEGLEVRGENLLTTLPPSVHPETGCYQWLIPPQKSEIPILSSLWLNSLRDCEPATKSKIGGYRVKNSQDVERLIWSIDPIYADNYDSWIRVGMATKDWDESLVWLWDEWSGQSSKYKPGEPEAKWASFDKSGITFRTLYYYAKL